MAGVTSARCLIPRFAQVIRNTTAVSIPLVHRRSYYDDKKRFCSSAPKLKRETVTVNFVCSDGTKIPTKAKVGDNLLDVVIENDVDLDGYGACEGTLACSTCHLIFSKDDYEKLPEEPSDEELDMLDLAYGLTDTSRLGCQIIVTKDMDGLVVRVPAGVADAREPS